jgi:hypothetical protein
MIGFDSRGPELAEGAATGAVAVDKTILRDGVERTVLQSL